MKPFSANKMHYMSGKRDTKEYKEFKGIIRDLLQSSCDIPEKSLLKLSLVGGTSSPLSDLDNFFKSCIDSLQLALNFNDRQIFSIEAYKELTKKGQEFLMLRIEEITEQEYTEGKTKLFPAFFKET